MSAAEIITETDVITVEQFLDMDLPEVCEWFLIHGTVVSVTRPNFPHSRIQSNIHALLLRLLTPGKALVFSELAYELGRTDCHCADVALLAAGRDALTIKAGGIVKGAPELVVEVMSRSNLPYDVDELERQCMASGCLMFWKVVIKHRKRLERGVPDYSVRVGRITGVGPDHVTYQRNDVIPVELPGISGTISVNGIFEGVLS